MVACTVIDPFGLVGGASICQGCDSLSMDPIAHTYTSGVPITLLPSVLILRPSVSVFMMIHGGGGLPGES